MTYSDFTAKQLKERFNIRFTAANILGEVASVEPSEWLKTTIAIGQQVGFSSEKSRSERLVSPVLLELSQRNNNTFTVYSGELLNADDKNGLNGECDFMLSFSKIIEFVTAPIFCITEAKKQNIEQGIIQCAAQLIGARKFNEDEDAAVETIYGCSTTGIEWSFLKLENDVITLDRQRFYITNLPSLLGALQYIIDMSSKP